MDYEDPIPGSFPPWTMQPSLQEMCDDAGVGHDQLLKAIYLGQTVRQSADEFHVSPETVQVLYDHFYRYGIGSVEGGD